MAGRDPVEDEAFAERHLPRLRLAVDELSWLLGRGYAPDAALGVVGDHHQLTRLQRTAVRRCACPDAAREERRRRWSEQAHRVAVDGFNQLVTLERGLAGGVVLRGRDGALRDVAGVHGTWRRTDGTATALDALVAALGSADAVWVLDRPVSNSGRLAGMLRERGPWQVELSDRADSRLLELAADGRALATSDGGLLDRCGPWTSLVERAIAGRDVRVVELYQYSG